MSGDASPPTVTLAPLQCTAPSVATIDSLTLPVPPSCRGTSWDTESAPSHTPFSWPLRLVLFAERVPHAMQVYIVPILQSQERNFAYILREQGSATVALVDPAEPQPILQVCRHLGVTPNAILTTHQVRGHRKAWCDLAISAVLLAAAPLQHWDHAGGNKELVQTLTERGVEGVQCVPASPPLLPLPCSLDARLAQSVWRCWGWHSLRHTRAGRQGQLHPGGLMLHSRHSPAHALPHPGPPALPLHRGRGSAAGISRVNLRSRSRWRGRQRGLK